MGKRIFCFFLILFLYQTLLISAEKVTRILVGQRTDKATYSDKKGTEVGEDFFVSTGVSFEAIFHQEKSGWGYNLFFLPLMQNEANLRNFPKTNDTSEIKTLKSSILVGFFYRWGDPGLGKKGNAAFRTGLQWGKAYTELRLKFNNEEYTTNRITDENGTFFAFDWGPFSITWINSAGFTDNSQIPFDGLTDDNGDTATLKTSSSVYTLGFSYYF